MTTTLAFLAGAESEAKKRNALKFQRQSRIEYEFKNLDVIIDFGIFSRSRIGSKEKDTQSRLTANLVAKAFHKTRKSCHHLWNETAHIHVIDINVRF